MAIGTNYLVTYYDVLSTMGVAGKGGYYGSIYKTMTKQDLINYFYIDTSYLTGYTSLQCVMYQDVHQLPTYTVTVNARKQFATDVLYFYYGLNSTTLVAPVLLGAQLTRAGATLSPTISVISGQTITVTTSDVNGPNNTGSKPTTASTSAYPAFATACTGYVTFTITANTTLYVSSGNGYTGWC